MGIKGLNKIISLYSNNAVSVQHISSLKNSKIAIDSEILIYQYRTNGDENSHIYGFINNIFWYIRNGILPIYVFDGAPSLSKRKNILSKRFSVKEKICQRAEELEMDLFKKLDSSNEEYRILDEETNDILDELNKIQKKITSLNVNRGHRHECKYLLKLMGIPYINAAEDAEALCISMYYNSLVDYVYTEDTDAIVYAIAQKKEGMKYPKILRKNFIPNMITVIDVEKILSNLELSESEFIDFSIICGCDFTVNIPKIGPMKSFYYIKKYKNIENFKDSNIIEIPDNFDYEEARTMFTKNYEQNIEKNLEIGEPDIENLKEYLINERNIYPYQIIDKMNQLIKHYQSNMYSSSFVGLESLESSGINNLVFDFLDESDSDSESLDFLNKE